MWVRSWGDKVNGRTQRMKDVCLIKPDYASLIAHSYLPIAGAVLTLKQLSYILGRITPDVLPIRSQLEKNIQFCPPTRKKIKGVHSRAIECVSGQRNLSDLQRLLSLNLYNLD